MDYSKRLMGLYGITDTTLTPYDRVIDMAKEAIDGGMKILQLRDKSSSDDELFDIAKELLALCRASNVLFIVDDRLELLKRLDADGIHVGKDDRHIREFRDEIKGKIIGVSCYGDIDRALEMEREGASYVAFGSFFVSPTKPKAGIVEQKVIKEAKSKLKIPICAIGGLSVENSKDIVEYGADMLAIVNDLWSAPSISKRAEEYKLLFCKL